MAPDQDRPAVERVVVPRTSDLGDGFMVRRALPSIGRRMVGPFVFLDEMGPVHLEAGKGLDVRPHPHIGLATVTYLYRGEIEHKDSLGTTQRIRPGEVNWMTAGRGIVHSERTPAELRTTARDVHGIQTWVALPKRHEETAPSFAHHPAAALPVVDGDGARLRVILGSLAGLRSPVATLSEMVYADLELAPGARFELAAEHEERALYLVVGDVEVDGAWFAAGQLVVIRPGAAVVIAATAAPARVLVVGGAALDGPRHVWWNFVASSTERIEQAKADWRADRLGAVAGDPERIPLPDEPPPNVRYP
jgi:redox-sensitive bicupin YhaK (pirin superfamily)